MTGVLMKRENVDTHMSTGRIPGECESKVIQTKIVSQPPEAGGRHETVSLTVSEGTNSMDTCVLNVHLQQ